MSAHQSFREWYALRYGCQPTKEQELIGERMWKWARKRKKNDTTRKCTRPLNRHEQKRLAQQ